MLSTNYPETLQTCAGIARTVRRSQSTNKAQQTERKFMTVAGPNRKGKGWGEQLETVNLAGAESVGQVKLTRWRLHCEKLVERSQ